MITELLLQAVLAIVAALLYPLGLLLSPIIGSFSGFLGQMFSLLRQALSWCSVWVSPGVLRVFIGFIPALWGLRGAVYVYRWVIEIVRG